MVQNRKKQKAQLACAEQRCVSQDESASTTLQQGVEAAAAQVYISDSKVMPGNFCPPVAGHAAAAAEDARGTCSQLNNSSLTASAMQLHTGKTHASRPTAAGGFNIVSSRSGSMGQGNQHQLHQLMLWDDIEVVHPHQ